MKLPLLTLLLSSSLFISLPSESAFSLFNKSPKNLDELKEKTRSEIKNLTTLRELSRMLRQMEAVYLQAKNIALKPEYKKRVEENLQKDFDLAQQNLTNLKVKWINQKKNSLDNLRNKSSLKADQISKLKSELEQLEAGFSNLINILEGLPPEGRILLLMTLTFATSSTSPQDNNTKKMFDGFQKLNSKIAQAQNQLNIINKGINNLESVLQKVETDPRFIRDNKDALARVEETQLKLTNIHKTYYEALKPFLTPYSQKSQELITAFQEKVKTLGCASLTSIGGGQRGIEQCREQSLKRLNEVAKKSKIKSCLLTLKSDDSSIESCAKEVGLSYLNLGQK